MTPLELMKADAEAGKARMKRIYESGVDPNNLQKLGVPSGRYKAITPKPVRAKKKPPASERSAALSSRRARSADLRSRGLTYQQIGHKLGIAPSTVVNDLRVVREEKANAAG